MSKNGQYVGLDVSLNETSICDPNSAGGWYYGGWVKIMLGEPEQAQSQGPNQ
jgi:hypothetical protein